MNAQRFEERLMHELKSYVQERARAPHEQAAEFGTQRSADVGTGTGTDTGTGTSASALIRHGGRRPHPRPRTVAAVGAGVTAAIAAAVLTTGAVGTAGTAPHALFHVANAAYAVQQEPAGVVKLTILDANGRPDVNALRRDLAKAGVDARVLADVAPCSHPLAHPRPTPRSLPPVPPVPDRIEFENGRLVYYLNTGEVTQGTTLSILFGHNLGTIGVALSASDDLPTCMPTATDH
jgi:hypothetical protein